MALHRLLLLAVATLLGAVATSGVQFSTAVYTATSAAPVTVTAANDWTPPTVAMTDPGSPLSGTVTVAATASDARSSVASVVIQRVPDGSGTWTTICTATVAPYSCSWGTTAVADGTYQLRAVATDTVGYSAISTIVSTTVVNTATVDLATVDDVVRGSVPLNVTVTGNAGATVTTRVEYVVAGGTTWATVPGCGNATGTTRSCTWVTSGAETYDVRAVATIGTQTYTDTQTDVLVDNVVPTITQTVPAGTLTGAVDVTAVADDVDSGVDTVTFEYKLSTAATWTTCGVDADAPYSCHLATGSWPNGTYSFRATATDLAGNTTTAAAVSRGVDNTAPSVSISAPTTGSVITTGATTVTADTFAVSGVTSVRLDARVSGGTFAPVCTDTTAPYSCPWSTAALASGTWELRAVMTPVTGAPVTSATVVVTVDNAVLKAQDVQAVNSGTSGRINAGDQVVLTYTTVVNLTTIKAGWAGASTPVTVTMKDKGVTGAGTGSDRMETDANLGYVAFVQDYLKNNKSATLTGSTMTATTATVAGVQVTVVTITLGTPDTSAIRSAATLGAMKWFPSAAARTPVGQACSTAAATESGANDKDL
jgi:hypothetical protein